MTHFLYFAYGSNMLSERLAARCPGAAAVDIGHVADHEVRFCTRSADGSGKAGLLRKEGAEAHGVLYRIPRGEQSILDSFESVPVQYQRDPVRVRTSGGGLAHAVTYRPHADQVVEGLMPFDWYHALCVAGARQNGLPEHAFGWLDVAVTQTHKANERAMRGFEAAVEALKTAGHAAVFEAVGA
jgi:gamma-glutamylcyclotransferase (GGCT)/AIG2-like uncharacterized protein YtfP